MDKEWLFQENKRLHDLSVELERERKNLERERKQLEDEKKNFDQQKLILETGFMRLAADKKAFMSDVKNEWQKRARQSYEDFQNRFEENQNREKERKKENLHQFNGNQMVGPGYFSGVNNLTSLKRRYKQLMKIYHPDNSNGDPFTVACINKEYEILQKKYE